MKRALYLLPLILLFLGSCQSSERLLRSGDVNMKLTKANEYYEAGKWLRACEFYQSILPAFRGSKYYEEICYRYCYSFYNMKDYLSASYQFKNFIEAFPNSERTDECEFMYAKCMFLQSPKYTLDQTVTYKAISVLQAYIDGHPNSPNLIVANNYIDICKGKIERKQAESAKLFYNMREYKAASVAYLSLIQQFPSSPNGDYYFFMRQKAFYQFAKASITSKQAERFESSIDSYAQLKQYYPQSEHLKEATSLMEEAEKEIKLLNQTNKTI